jgi:quercetin dioxygenase-like cupin family protein
LGVAPPAPCYWLVYLIWSVVLRDDPEYRTRRGPIHRQARRKKRASGSKQKREKCDDNAQIAMAPDQVRGSVLVGNDNRSVDTSDQPARRYRRQVRARCRASRARDGLLHHGQRGTGPTGPGANLLAYRHLFERRRSGGSQRATRNCCPVARQNLLFTIAEAGWRPASGERVAQIGPLPINSDVAYTAMYMEAVFRPGMKSTVHRHSGPEVWYTLTGETCLETPDGTMVGRAGGQYVIVPGGPPMELTAIGTEVRRAEVLILHDSSKPHSSAASDWKPKGLCQK